MGKILTHMTMSLDGYIADPHDQVEGIFDWYSAGEVTIETPNEDVTLKVDQASAQMLRELIASTGALISGRRLFDIAKGWSDRHPIGAPVVVVTHSPPADAAEKWPKTTFVDGVEAAVTRAKAIAGDKNVVISSANIIQQALELGLVDEIWMSVAPVLFGEGIPYFSKLRQDHLFLEDPVVIQGNRALHLMYQVRR
jgi:dihydrofolate reductase